jgi:hypothetical protein
VIGADADTDLPLRREPAGDIRQPRLHRHRSGGTEIELYRRGQFDGVRARWEVVPSEVLDLRDDLPVGVADEPLAHLGNDELVGSHRHRAVDGNREGVGGGRHRVDGTASLKFEVATLDGVDDAEPIVAVQPLERWPDSVGHPPTQTRHT